MNLELSFMLLLVVFLGTGSLYHIAMIAVLIVEHLRTLLRERRLERARHFGGTK